MKISKMLLSVAGLMGFAAFGLAQGYTFRTLAGQGPVGSTNGTGAAARFREPVGVAVDRLGNLFVADELDHCIRKITPAGLVTTFAGMSGFPGYLDGAEGGARFDTPEGVAVDSSGNVYVADAFNMTIRVINIRGVVSTLAGSPGQYANVDGAGSFARFMSPSGLAIDSADNIYVADQSSHTIRKVTLGGFVTTLAGSPENPGSDDGGGSAARFDRPVSVAVDGAGNLYVADRENATIRKVTSVGVVTTLAGAAGARGSNDGVGASARFNDPLGLAVDRSGNIYVADGGNHTVRKVTPDGVVTTLAGSAQNSGTTDGIGGAARFHYPDGLILDGAGNLVVADAFNSLIRRITPAGVVTTIAGGGYGSADGPGATALFKAPAGLAADTLGNVYVADSANSIIRRVARSGTVSTMAGVAGQYGSADGFGPQARFMQPLGVALDSTGNIYITDGTAHNVPKMTALGIVTTVAGGSGVAGSADGGSTDARFNGPTGVAVDRNGLVYIADYFNHTIRKIAPSGLVTTFAGRAGNAGSADGAGGAARFNGPSGVAVDAAGNVFVADYVNSTVRKITSNGVVSTLAGQAGASGSADGIGNVARFAGVSDLTVDSAGNVYVADYSNSTIRRVTPAGVVTTIAGRAGLTGDSDGLGTAVRFFSPSNITVDSTGVLFVSEFGNNTIRQGTFIPQPSISTQPGSVTTGFRGTLTLSLSAAAPTGGPAATYQWQFNGTNLVGGTSPALLLTDVQPRNVGLYSVVVTSVGTLLSAPAIVGINSNLATIGTASSVATNIPHANGNFYDQVGLTGAAAGMNASAPRILRTSFIDLNDDIVQVEFSGAGTLSVVLDNPTGPATPTRYNQPTVTYMKGHAGIVVAGANETTNLSVFSVGRRTAVNQSLFYSDVAYDGRADIAFIAVLSTNGRFGGIRAANTRFSAIKGHTGIYAPNVQFTGPVFVGNIEAFDAAVPLLILGSATDVRVTGGDLYQDNGKAVQVSGITQLRFTTGTTSHGDVLAARKNAGRLEQSDNDVTAQIVVNPP